MADEITSEVGSTNDTINSLLRTSMGDISGFKLPTPPKMRTGEELKKDYESYGKDISAYKKAEAEAGVRKAQLEASSARELANKYEPQFQQTPDFVPSEENKASLIGLFGLIGAIGAFGGGKSYGSAIGAMNAMGGMLKGYSQGRKDLFEREKAEFDKHMQSVKSHNDEIMKAYARAKDLAKTDLGVAQAKLVSDLNSLGARVQANEVKEKGIVAGEEANMKAYNAAKQQYDSLVKTLAAMKKGDGKGTGARSQMARQFENQMTISANEAAAQIKNIISAPFATSGMFGGKRSEGLAGAPLDVLANKLTPGAVQQYNNNVQGLGYELAKIMGGGRVVPIGTQKAFASQFEIREGDAPFTVLEKIAKMRQSFERAIEVQAKDRDTPSEMKEIYNRGLNDIKNAIPFTVDDVLAAQSEASKPKGKKYETFGSWMSKRMPSSPAPAAPAAAPAPAAPAPAAPAAPAAPVSSEDQQKAVEAFGSYEPNVYEYGINPATGKFARKRKAQ